MCVATHDLASVLPRWMLGNLLSFNCTFLKMGIILPAVIGKLRIVHSKYSISINCIIITIVTYLITLDTNVPSYFFFTSTSHHNFSVQKDVQKLKAEIFNIHLAMLKG